MVPKSKVYIALFVFLVLCAALAAPTFVQAGGWVVITLDRLPEQVIAGQPYPVGMMAQQHGRTPWQVRELRIQARQVETGKSVTFTAEPDDQLGHYQAELLFPEPGRWEWGIESGMHPALQPMPALDVGESLQSAAAVGDSPAQKAANRLAVPGPVLAALALFAFAAGIAVIYRSRNRRSAILVSVGWLILCGGLAFTFFTSANAETKQAQPASETVSADGTGQKLFLAKGCVVCHTNDRAIKGSEEYGVNFGPNLTSYRNDPDFLHQLLKDPQSVKATSEMPDLGLKLVEIEALIHFINAQE